MNLLGIIGMGMVLGVSLARDLLQQQYEVRKALEVGISHDLQRIPPAWEMRMALDSNNANLTATPSVLSSSGDRVRIRIERSLSNGIDYLAAYTPAGANVSEVAPARVAEVEYAEDGVAEIDMYLTNMRDSYDFVLYSTDWWCGEEVCHGWWTFDGGEAANTAVARSSPVAFEDEDEQRGVRILPASGNDSWKLVWTSKGNDGPYFCTVQGKRVDANSQTIAAEDMCGSPATTIGFNCAPSTTHSVLVENCPPGTRVEYECGKMKGSFRCSPDANQNETTIVVYGDMGRGERPEDDSVTWNEYGSPAAYTARLLQKEDEDKVDFVYHIGDISYAVGYASVWDDYIDMMAPFFKRFKYGLNLGNHEFDYPTFPSGRVPSYYTGHDSGGECGVPTQHHFPMPYDVDSSPWWSRDIGLVHVVAMCTECDFRKYSSQWRWLKEDLASVDRRKTPWILFGGHRPGYIDSTWSSSNGNNNGDIENMLLWIEHVEPLIVEYSVDICVWGHNHVAQRTCAVINGICRETSEIEEGGYFTNPTAPIHMVVGTGGAGFTKNAYGAPFAQKVFYRWGYARMVVNKTHLDWKFLDNGANDQDNSTAGRVLDTLTIVKVEGGTENNKSNPEDDDDDAGESDDDEGPHNFTFELASLAIGLVICSCLVCTCSSDKEPAEPATTSTTTTTAEDRQEEDDTEGEVRLPPVSQCEMVSKTGGPAKYTSLV